MAVARFVVPGTTYLITRRCSHRQLLLRPDAVTCFIFRFCLAVAARRHGVEIHGVCCLSNHVHILCTDVRGELAKFEEWLNRSVAKCMNIHRKRFENFWASPGSYSAVIIAGEEDFLRKLVYIAANPVEAGLVARGHQWPGVRMLVGGVGEARYSVSRPSIYFDSQGTIVPQRASLELSRPRKFFAELSDEEFSARVRAAVREREEEIRETFARRKKTFLGREGVLAQSPFWYPESREERFKLNPRVAAVDTWKRVELLQTMDGFLRSYAAALKEWVAGRRDVVFPFGTYLMKVFHHANCAPAPA